MSRVSRINGRARKVFEKNDNEVSLVSVIAQVAHNVNAAYCAALGDLSQVPWEDAPEWQRESCLKGVELHLANPDAGPEASHEAWFLDKKLNGWVYGEKKNVAMKIHPCMVAFNDLPVDQQAKDFIFRAVVLSLAEKVEE